MPKILDLSSSAGPNDRASGKWGWERRLEFIDYRLQLEGQPNRSDLIDVFGISVPQASLDLARYMEFASEKNALCGNAQAYLASEHFKSAFNIGDPERYLNYLLGLISSMASKEMSFIGWMSPVAVVRIPT